MGLLTCNVLTLKRFIALQIVVPLETNQFKKTPQRFNILIKNEIFLKYFHFNLSGSSPAGPFHVSLSIKSFDKRRSDGVFIKSLKVE